MSTSDELERGIDLLLEQMPDYVQDLVSDIANQALLPKWQLLGGILFEAYNNGYLSAYTLDPSWKDCFKPQESVCNFCKKTYMPVRVGQLYCSNDCGCGITVLEVDEPEKAQPQPESAEESKVESTKESSRDDEIELRMDKIKDHVKKETKKNVKSKSSSKSKSALANLAKSNVTRRVGTKSLNKASGSGWTDEALPD